MSVYTVKIKQGEGKPEKEIKFEKKWITHGIEFETDLYANAFGKYIANNGLSTSSIRNIFSEVKRLKMKLNNDFSDIKTDFILLKSKLKYAVKRAKNPNKRNYDDRGFQKMLPIYEATIIAAHEAVNENGDVGAVIRYKSFANFFEAVLAYHKVHNGAK